MGSLNIGRGFLSKEEEIASILQDCNLDVLFLQELDLRHYSTELLHFPGYQSFVNAGPRKITATFVKNNVFKSTSQLPSPENLPHVWILVEEYSGRKTVLANVYREWHTGPLGTRQQDQELSTLLGSIHQKSGSRILLAGDFNLDIARQNDTNYGSRGLLNRFRDESAEAGLELTDFGPTFLRIVQGKTIKSHLDWTLANFEISCPKSIRYEFSDHSLITWQMQLHKKSEAGKEGSFWQRNLKKIDINKFTVDLMMQPWEELDELTADKMAERLVTLFLEPLDKHAPMTLAHSQETTSPKPSAALAKLRRKRDNARGKGKFHLLKELRTRCKALAKTESIEFYKKRMENGSKKRFWNTVNRVLGKRKQLTADITIGEQILSPFQAASAFNKFFIEKIAKLKDQIESTPCDTFDGTRRRARRLNLREGGLSLRDMVISERYVEKIIRGLKSSSCPDVYGISPDALKLCPQIMAVPLTRVIQKCLSENKFPKLWKSARVIPVYKKGKKGSVENYRPISILPTFSKVLETVIKNALTSYLEEKDILPDSQFGFRQGLSTHDAIIAAEHDVKKSKQDKKACGALLFDLSAAFDTIDLGILLEKLRIYGADDPFLALIESYLSERSQRVSYQGVDSVTVTLDTGSPQGSILSPVLFLTLISDIEEWVKGAKIWGYADDISLFASALTKQLVREALEQGSVDILLFMASMKLFANPGKTKFIMFSRDEEPAIQVGDVSITESKEVTFLGVTFTKLLTWNSQYKKLEATLRQKIGVLRRLAGKLPKAVTKTLLQPLFISNILHYLPTLADLETSRTPFASKLHSLHRQAMKAALGIPSTKHPDDDFLLSATNQTPIKQFLTSLLMSQACKIFPNWQNHPVSKNRVIAHSMTRCTRQNQRTLPPQLIGSSLSSLVELFEQLPPDIRNESNLLKRKKKIRQYVTGQT